MQHDTKPYAITVDLDSTLCDTRGRDRALIEGYTEEGAREYALQCDYDVLVEPVAEVVRMARRCVYDVIIVTARDMAARSLTERWLRDHKIYYSLLVMPLEHCVDTSKWKATVLKNLREEFHIVMHIDDWPGVRTELGMIGIPTLLVTPPGVESPSPVSLASQGQVARLAQFLMDTVPGEPSQSESAVDTAIRLLRQQLAH